MEACSYMDTEHKEFYVSAYQELNTFSWNIPFLVHAFVSFSSSLPEAYSDTSLPSKETRRFSRLPMDGRLFRRLVVLGWTLAKFLPRGIELLELKSSRLCNLWKKIASSAKIDAPQRTCSETTLGAKIPQPTSHLLNLVWKIMINQLR